MTYDPYHILGVSPEASSDEIRRQYRNLARKYHPDVNHDPEAESFFKELGLAYSILSDPQRRALFEEFGEASLHLQFNAEMARQQARQQQPGPAGPPPRGHNRPPPPAGSYRRGRPPSAEVPYPPNSRQRRSAPDAAGYHGSAAPSRRHRPTPYSQQPVSDSSDVHTTLEVELGLALLGGEVRVSSPLGGASLHLVLPPSVEDGHQIRVKGRGRPGRHGRPPGDLIFEVQVLPHPYFRRQGYHLFLDLPLTVLEAHEGAAVDIPTLEGWIRLTVPAGTRGGEKLRLRSRGLYRPDGSRGDLLVHLCIRLPERLTALGRSLYRLDSLYDQPLRRDLNL